MTLKELAETLGCSLEGDPETEITGASSLEDAGPNHVTFFINRKNLASFLSTSAGGVITSEEMKNEALQEGGVRTSLLITGNPHKAFARALEILYPPDEEIPYISEKAHIEEEVQIGDRVSVQPFAVIRSSARIGKGSVISSGAYIGRGVRIGENVFIHPNVTVRDRVLIGNNVVIHAGTVIGADGFGYLREGERHLKIPQVGGVVIEDDVEIGANVTIDRATVGNTIIGSGSRIDNLVQIAHNVRIGKNSIIVAQAGISGSVEIGEGAVLAGQVGVRDHVRIGRGAVVGAQSGVGSDVPDGQIYSGSPAMPHRKWLRAQFLYSKLPDLMKRLKDTERSRKKEEEKDD
jgi:UDP-3-O-[3-hydroxymyristoyl] glucosamine N-acyltransferase